MYFWDDDKVGKTCGFFLAVGNLPKLWNEFLIFWGGIVDRSDFVVLRGFCSYAFGWGMTLEMNKMNMPLMNWSPQMFGVAQEWLRKLLRSPEHGFWAGLGF